MLSALWETSRNDLRTFVSALLQYWALSFHVSLEGPTSEVSHPLVMLREFSLLTFQTGGGGWRGEFLDWSRKKTGEYDSCCLAPHL